MKDFQTLSPNRLEQTPAYNVFVNSLSDIGDLQTISFDIWAEY